MSVEPHYIRRRRDEAVRGAAVELVVGGLGGRHSCGVGCSGGEVGDEVRAGAGEAWLRRRRRAVIVVAVVVCVLRGLVGCAGLAVEPLLEQR